MHVCFCCVTYIHIFLLSSLKWTSLSLSIIIIYYAYCNSYPNYLIAVYVAKAAEGLSLRLYRLSLGIISGLIWPCLSYSHVKGTNVMFELTRLLFYNLINHSHTIVVRGPTFEQSYFFYFTIQGDTDFSRFFHDCSCVFMILHVFSFRSI